MCNTLTDVSASVPSDVDAKTEDMDIGDTPQVPDPTVQAKEAEVIIGVLNAVPCLLNRRFHSIDRTNL
jgi:hypothetical protein